MIRRMDSSELSLGIGDWQRRFCLDLTSTSASASASATVDGSYISARPVLRSTRRTLCTKVDAPTKTSA